MKNMVLGVFNTTAMEFVKATYNAETYPFKKNILTDDEYMMMPGVVDIVDRAIRKCDRCYFVLDYVASPLNPNESVTCEELEHILRSPWLLDKIRFMYQNKEMPHEEVLTRFKTSDHGQ